MKGSCNFWENIFDITVKFKLDVFCTKSGIKFFNMLLPRLLRAVSIYYVFGNMTSWDILD